MQVRARQEEQQRAQEEAAREGGIVEVCPEDAVLVPHSYRSVWVLLGVTHELVLMMS